MILYASFHRIYKYCYVLFFKNNFDLSKQYEQAVKMMRRHRINFNLLHDYNPNLFLSNVKQFLQSIDDPDLITLFISDLV